MANYRLTLQRFTLTVALPILLFCATLTLTGPVKNEPSTEYDPSKPLSSFKCNKTQMDQAVRWLFFFNDPERVLPSSQKGSDDFCDEKSRKELFVKDYATACLPKFPKQITSLLMFGIAKKNRYYCSNSKGRNDYLQFANCLNTIKAKGATCMNDLIRDMMAIKNAPLKSKIGKTCCVYYRFEDCIVHQAQEETRVCTTKDVKLTEELFEEYTGQMLQHVCAKYPRGIDNCAKLIPKREMTKLRKKVTDKELKTTFSLLPPLIEILESIPPA